jgi:4-amino-4-deoxy-L-arabinose transferase-like glycosyltransferase
MPDAASTTTAETTPSGRTNDLVERVSQGVAAAATLWFAVAVTWGLFARIGGGHDAQIATRAIVAENMRVWHILAPVKDYFLRPPGPDSYYVHHPWGTFWLWSAAAEVFGRATWVPRMVGVLISITIPPLLYGIGRALWGPVPGAIAALAYTVLPIALAFGNLPGFEVPVNFSVCLATWGYLKFAQRWRRRWMVVSLAGVFAGANSDWDAVVFTGAVLVCLAGGALWLPRWFGRVRLQRFAEWWVLASLLTAATLLGYVAYFQHCGALENLIHSETQRARGAETVPLLDALRVRSYWIDVCFTPLAVTIGKLAVPVFVWRILVGRRILEIFPLAILAMATLEYVKLKNGADVHIYWPLGFAPYWALSLAVLTESAIDLARSPSIRARLGEANALVPLVALGVFGLVALRILPDGITGLRYGKATAGRFNEKGRRIFDDVDMSQAFEWMGDKMETETVVAMLKDLYGRENRAQEWALHRPVNGLTTSQFTSASTEERYFVGDLRFMNGEDQKRAASTFHMITLGPYVFMDRRAHAGPVDAFAFEEREPTFFEWYWAYPTEPVRTIRPDPWGTWELREHYEQSPNPAPREAPSSLEQIRIAHNVAVAAGDTAGTVEWRGKLMQVIDTSSATTFTDGTRLLGRRFVRGVDPTLEIYFLAAGPLASEFLFEVTSVVEAAPPLSLVPPDDKVKKYGPPFALSPRLWRSGFIYVERVDVRHRPGRERFSGYFETQATGNATTPAPGSVPAIGSKAPRPTEGPSDVQIMTIQ